MRAFLILFISLFFAIDLLAQNTVTIKSDTILIDNSSIGLIKMDGSGWKISALDGKWWISAREGGFRFSTGQTAYPHTTTFSKEATVQFLVSNAVFSKGSLNQASIAGLLKKYPVKRTVLPELRTNPISTSEE